jgi:type VI secretion system protein ImpC
MDIPHKPFTIIAIGSFAPVPDGHERVRIIPVDTANDALSILRPAVWIPVAKEICPAGGIGISPEKMKDLTPQGMMGSVSYLKNLADARDMITRSAGMPPGNIAAAIREKWPELPLDLTINPPTARPQQASTVDNILSMVAAEGGSGTIDHGTMEGSRALTAHIESLIAGTMKAIFSDGAFRELETAWRGIELITKQGPAGSTKDTRLAIVNTSRDGLGDTLRELGEAWENDPPDLVLIDFLFDNSPVSMELFEEAAAFAQDLIVPAVVNASAGFLGLGDWNEIDRLPMITHYIEDNPVYAKWSKLRKDPRANWLGAACNDLAVRQAYGKDSGIRGIVFEEGSPPWVHPVFAVGALAAQSVAFSGWPSRLVDAQTVRLDGLALHRFEDGTEGSTRAVFSVDRLRQLGDIGLMPLAGAPMKDLAFLPAARTIAGEALAFQMFFSRLTGFLIRLREQNGASIPDDDAPSWLTRAFEMFFRLSGGTGPADLSIDASTHDERLVFAISLTPPGTILSGTRRISFTFAW